MRGDPAGDPRSVEERIGGVPEGDILLAHRRQHRRRAEQGDDADARTVSDDAAARPSSPTPTPPTRPPGAREGRCWTTSAWSTPSRHRSCSCHRTRRRRSERPGDAPGAGAPAGLDPPRRPEVARARRHHRRGRRHAGSRAGRCSTTCWIGRPTQSSCRHDVARGDVVIWDNPACSTGPALRASVAPRHAPHDLAGDEPMR